MVGKGKSNPASYKSRPTRLEASAGDKVPVSKIVSGGQTGVDRAALDFAREQGIAHGGWCPRGRWAEDGDIHEDYELDETPERNCAQRTAWNIRDSDGTVIFTVATRLSGGSALTRKLALCDGKPCLHLAKEADGDNAAARLREFIRGQDIQVLNVAGPRLSTEPGARAFARQVLEAAVVRGRE